MKSDRTFRCTAVKFLGPALAVWCCLAAWAAADPIRIGFIAPLTGSRASIGEDARRAGLLALEDLSGHEGGGIELVFDDSQGDPRAGVSAYKQLLAQGIKIVITQNSNVSLPIAELVNNDQVVQLAISTTSDRYSRPDDLTFRLNGPTRFEAQRMVSFLQSRLRKVPGKVALVTMQDEYPVQLRDNVLTELSAGHGGLYQEEFLPGELDFRTIITKFKAAHVAYLVLLTYQMQAGRFVRQASEMGFRPQVILACTPVNNREFFEAAGDSGEGVFVTSIAIDVNHPANDAFRKRHGHDMNSYSANAYDAVRLLAEVIARCGDTVDVQCAKRELFAIKRFKGVSGEKGFDDRYGDMRDEYSVLIARRGLFAAP